MVHAKSLSPKQAKQINDLWNEEYPLNLKDKFHLLLQGTEKYNHYVIEDTNNNVIAWATDFERENATWFSIIVSSEYKGKGLGKLLIEKLKSENTEFYGWVIDHNKNLKSNGEHYKTPMPFYLKQGFEILSDVRMETDIISAVKIKWKCNLTFI
ncbi:MAG: GNAT family N-acetyltransferase [Bacteroidetes bacterium]|nr:GNAT family N-acetyltransferase [Bacteroidota bacterium]